MAKNLVRMIVSEDYIIEYEGELATGKRKFRDPRIEKGIANAKQYPEIQKHVEGDEEVFVIDEEDGSWCSADEYFMMEDVDRFWTDEDLPDAS